MSNNPNHFHFTCDDITFKTQSTHMDRMTNTIDVRLKVVNRPAHLRTRMAKAWQLYTLLSLPLIWLLVFRYLPMYGAIIAFKNFQISKGILGSPWVGFANIRRFVTSYQFLRVLRNTLVLSFYSLIAGFPLPILLALALNYVTNIRYKKTVQLVTYAPHFISTVVMVGMIFRFLDTRSGVVNNFIGLLGFEAINFMAKPELFSSIYVWTGVWQNLGYGSIIYLAALSSIDPELHSAAIVDGATKIQRMWYVDIPGILPTATVLLIMNTGRVLEVGFEKVFLMQNPLNLRVSEIINTYVYKVGLTAAFPNYSYSAAIGLFKSVIGLLLIIIVNRIAKTLSETSLW